MQILAEAWMEIAFHDQELPLVFTWVSPREGWWDGVSLFPVVWSLLWVQTALWELQSIKRNDVPEDALQHTEPLEKW